MIYEKLPEPGDIVHPFGTINGYCNWKVVDVKTPENDVCYEIYIEDLDNKFTLFWAGPFSQWHFCQFTIGGVTYNCAEQFMMAEKARLFGDKDSEALIMAAAHPRDQKYLGRNVKNFDKAKWEEIQPNGKPYCWNVVYKGNYAKFDQNKGLLEELVKTQGTVLVEASPYDTIWGIGLGEDHPDASDRTKWKGTNWLGEVLTKLREDILREAQELWDESTYKRKGIITRYSNHNN
jgi:ribA/ribD-fused uncharacterized protein